MKTKLVIFTILLGFLWSCYQPTTVGKKDIYVKRFVYLKRDKSLFTGILEVNNTESYYYVNFSNGIPIGEWAEHQNGGSYVSKGKYLEAEEILSKTTRNLLRNDIFIIDYWQEGGDLHTDPYHFNLLILKKDAFFDIEKNRNDIYVNNFANAVNKDTYFLKYDYLKISYVNAVYNWTKEYSKEYKRYNGKLLEILKD